MARMTIGLTFPGTCEKAFNLYKSVFGVELSCFITFGGDPATAAATPEKDKDKVAYVEMKVGGVVLWGDDTLESSGVTPGTNTAITYEPESVEEADRVFNALVHGGRILSPNAMYPWGYCGSLVDAFGVKWGLFHRTPGK